MFTHCFFLVYRRIFMNSTCDVKKKLEYVQYAQYATDCTNCKQFYPDESSELKMVRPNSSPDVTLPEN